MATAKRKARSGAAAPAQAAAMEPETLHRAFRDMLLLRRFEEKASQLYGMGMIGGFCHLYIGQEAVVTGVQYALGPGDSVIHRLPLPRPYADRGACRRATSWPSSPGARLGASKGQGRLHAPVLARARLLRRPRYRRRPGAARRRPLGFAHKYRASDRISVTYFGDGAANQGQVFEAFNMAALWQLPVLFVIENNQYAMGTSVERSAAVSELHERGAAFGIPRRAGRRHGRGRRAPGGRRGCGRPAGGQGPASAGNDDLPVPAATRCPIRRSTGAARRSARCARSAMPSSRRARALLDGGHADEDALKEIDREIKAIVNDAADFAQGAPEPAPVSLEADIVARA